MFFRHTIWAIVWAIIIFISSVISADNVPEISFKIIFIDKIAHFIIYALLSLFLMIGLKKQYTFELFRYKAVQSSIIIAAIYGIILESVQLFFTETRAFEVGDIIANILGAMFGYVIFRIIYGQELAKG